MRVRNHRKAIVLLLLLLLALVLSVTAVAAANSAGVETTIAAADVQGAEGIMLEPVSGTDQRWIGPWGIDATRGPNLIEYLS